MSIANFIKEILCTLNCKPYLHILFHVTTISYNLLLISNLVFDSNASISFDIYVFTIKDDKTNKVLLQKFCLIGLYKLPIKKISLLSL